MDPMLEKALQGERNMMDKFFSHARGIGTRIQNCLENPLPNPGLEDEDEEEDAEDGEGNGDTECTISTLE